MYYCLRTKITLVQVILFNFNNFSKQCQGGRISLNVTAVYDGLPARIRACVARPGLANCAGVRRGNEAKRNDLAGCPYYLINNN